MIESSKLVSTCAMLEIFASLCLFSLHRKHCFAPFINTGAKVIMDAFPSQVARRLHRDI